MSTTLLEKPDRANVATSAEWRWTREEFLRLSDGGFFGESDAELVSGRILVRDPPAPYHSGTIAPLSDVIRAAFGWGIHVRSGQPLITNSMQSLPQPDLAVCAGTADDYRHRYPTAAEILLVIEVADRSLEKDRGVKLLDYAASGIPEYWIVNLREQCVEVYRSPAGEGYRSRRTFGPTEYVSPLSAPESRVHVADILGS